MRILAIRGQNLASLAQPFSLDLAAEPLASTGLFAITGDTGAGKSTILDALCLALYDDYPRAGGGRLEKVRDASGEAISANDPANILRRSAASGFAEVDFVGIDGTAYRARWDMRRSRHKATGRLQDAARKLTRCEDGTTVASGKIDVAAAIIARSGFTFEQFRRTVLLAQGEFDTFLLAAESDRAELLEKITGTAVYSHISMRVFEETVIRRRTINELLLRHGEIVVLDDTARAALAAEHLRRTREKAEQATICAQLNAAIARAEAIAKAQIDCREAEEGVARASAALTAVAVSRTRLADLRAVDAVRPKAAALAENSELLAASEAEAAISGQAALRAEATVRSEHASLSAAAAAHRAASADVVRCEPLWQAAAALDGRIETSNLEATRAADAALAASERVTRRKVELAEIAQRIQTIEQGLNANSSALADRAAHRTIAHDLDRIERLFGTRRQLADKSAIADQRRKSIDTEIAAAETRLAAALARVATQVNERKHLLARIDCHRADLAAIDVARLRAHEASLGNLGADVERTIEVMLRRDDALRQEQSVETEALAAETRCAAIDRDLEQAQAAYRSHLASRHDLQPLAELADATVSEHAVALRSLLVDAESCPVCGAIEHPFAHGDNAGTRLANEIRARRAGIEKDVAAAAQQIDHLRDDQAKARGLFDLSIRVAAAQRDIAANPTATLAEALPRIQTALIDLALPFDDASFATVDGLQAVGTRVAATRLDLSEQCRTADILRHELDALQVQSNAIGAAIESATGLLDDDRKGIARSATERAEITATRAALAEQLADLDEELAPFLDAGGSSRADVDRDDRVVLQRLRTLAAMVAHLTATKDRLTTEQNDLTRDLHAATIAMTTADDAKRQAEAERAARLQTLRNLQEQRTSLLEGQATGSHRDRIRGAEEAARAAFEMARDAHAAAEAFRAEQRAIHQGAVRAAEGAGNRHKDAVAAMASAVAATALDEATVHELLAVTIDEINRITAQLETLDAEASAAHQARQLRQRDLDILLADSPAPAASTIADLRDELNRRTTAAEQLGVRLAEIKVATARDDDDQTRARKIETELETVRSDFAVWDAVDQAIGQRDGGKFRRFAQSVTLDQLVRLANDQLAALNPRYALARGTVSDLTLEAIDRDMGDEVRTPRSLSGGERFIVSLALALALSNLEGRQSFVDTLFIDEGFGTLDRDTLDMVIGALEALQGHGRKVGVITHVPAMIERIAVQVRVIKRGGGRSVIEIRDGDRLLV